MKNRIKIFSFILTGMLILGPFLSCSGAVSPDGHDEEPAEQPSNTGTNKPSAVTNFTVTFNSDGGTAITPQTVRKGSLATRPADPQKEGYIFLGWFISDDLYDFSTPVNSNITLTAKWELPDLEDIYITSSTQDIVQTIKNYEQPEDAEHPDTINIYVIGQTDLTKLTQINTGIIEWAEAYHENKSTNPDFTINLDLQYSTGITELNSNSITLGNTSYEAELEYLVKLSPHTSYIATDALTGLNSSKIKFLIEEKLYTFTAPENEVLKLYDEQGKNTLSFANGISLKALENGVNVSFFKDKIWLSTDDYYPVQLTVGQDTIYFYYFTTDFENNIAKYFIPFSDVNKDFTITFYPTGTMEATSVQVEALGGLGFPLKQAFFDTTLEVSCKANPDQASVQINTSANSLSDWFVAPNLLNNNWRPTIYCNFYVGDSKWYASNNITLANDNSFAYLRDNTIKGVTNNNSVSLSNYILQDCSANITLEFYLNDEHNTAFTIDPYITASAAISEQWIIPYTNKLNITPDTISNISAITENTQIILRETSGKYFSNSDLQAVADALRQLSLAKPDLRIALQLPAFQNITELPTNLFKDCTILAAFQFSPIIQRFGYHCFENCKNLRLVYYTGTLEEWLRIDFKAQSNPCCHNAVLYIYIDNKLEPITDVNIPATITTLNNYAFSSCESLKKVTIPDTVYSIGTSAFSTCHNLESVTISDTSLLEEIGSYAFWECYKLTEITIPEPGNWYILDYATVTPTEIPVNLANSSNAAKLLTKTDYNHEWHRRTE